MAFLLGAWQAAELRRPVLAGLLVGVATGCRITSGAMLLPLALVVHGGTEPRRRWADVTWLAVSALLVGSAAFLPALLRYGLGFFTFYEEGGYPALARVAERGTLGVWGQVGMASLLLAPVAVVFCRGRAAITAAVPPSPGRRLEAAWALAVVLYVVAYLRLPHESAYLIPAVPFVILVAGRVLPRAVFTALCVGLAASSFAALAPVQVPAAAQQRERTRRLEEIAAVVKDTQTLEGEAVVVTGWWQDRIRGLLALGQIEGLPGIPSPERVPMDGPLRIGNVEYVWLLDAESLSERVARGLPVYYLPLQREYNLAKFGVDLRAHGARAFYRDPM